MIQTTIEQPTSSAKHQQHTTQSAQLPWQAGTTLTESKINSMYNLIAASQTIPTQLVNSKQKLQYIFEYMCEHRADILHIFVIQLADYIRQGWIVLRNPKFAGLFQELIFGRIRQPLEEEQQYIRHQGNSIKQKTANVGQNIKEVHEQPEIRVKIDQILAPLTIQLVKQQYNHAVIDKHICTILATYQKQQPQTATTNLWQLPIKVGAKELICNQYNLHLLKILTNCLHNSTHTQYYSDALVQGWLYPQSRAYLIKYINYSTNSPNQHKLVQLDAVYALCRVLEQSNQALTKQWQIVNYLCLQQNNKYQEFKINQILAAAINSQSTDKLIQLIKQSNPATLQYLHSQQQYAPLYSQLASRQPTTANIQYLIYLHDSSLPANKHEQLTIFINSQLNRITKQLINNTYPTPAIIINSYRAITNICYQIQHYLNNSQNNQEQIDRVDIWNKMVSKLAVVVNKHMLELVMVEEFNHRQMSVLINKQMLVIVGQHLPAQYCGLQDNSTKITVQQSSNILKISKTAHHHLTKNKLQQLSINHNNQYLQLLAAEYLTQIQYTHDYIVIAEQIAACLLPALTQPPLLGVADKYLSILWGLASKYATVCEKVIACVAVVFDAVEKQQKILAYLCKAYSKQNNQVSIFHGGPTIASIALSLSVSPSPAVKIPESAPSILSQLIQTKSNIIHKCQTLLTQSPTGSLTPYLLQIHNPTSPNYKIYNLYQYNNIGIKYHEITQHNPDKQCVFDSDLYRNHCNIYMYLQCMKIYLDSCIQSGGTDVVEQICVYIVDNLRHIKKIQSRVVHTSGQFYSILNVWKFIHVMVYYRQVTEWLTLKYQQGSILQELLSIAEAGAIHPLVRQYISLIIGKLYHGQAVLQVQNIRDQWRGLLISKITPNNQNININVYVPVIFTLGYQMIENTVAQVLNRSHQKSNEEAQQIFQIFIRYISCHHAYIRSIVQFYIKAKVQIQNKEQNNKQQENKSGSFLQHLCQNLWKNDKDCIKILRNIGIAVEGFREAMKQEESLEFLGYERVEQYPNQVVFRQLRHDLAMVLKQFLNCTQTKLKKLRPCETMDSSHKYLELVGIGIKKKLKKIDKLNEKYLSPRIPLVIHYKLPDIIIIASLLEKVHNFGYILRTLHQQRAMLLVPSKQPLEHPECKQFIPKNSQVEVIEIKQTQVEKFIQMNKKLGYPMIGLEQCAGSVKIQQYKFPHRYMLLLGNQRIGAPASLLNLADVLVEIPQVGKVRSLNVHVSMAICVWQSIINHQK